VPGKPGKLKASRILAMERDDLSDEAVVWAPCWGVERVSVAGLHWDRKLGTRMPAAFTCAPPTHTAVVQIKGCFGGA
jgi:hypothetical protein